MCSCEDFDSPAFSSYGFRKARKVYLCCECGGPIHVGQSYQYYTAKHDDSVNTYKTCSWCVAIIAGYDAVKDEPHCSYEIGWVREAIRNCMHEYGFDGTRSEMWAKFRQAFKQARAS